jgi:hypothetical protein
MAINPSDISNIGLAGGSPVEAMAQGYKLADLVDQRAINKMKMQGVQQEMQDVQTIKNVLSKHDVSTPEGQAKAAAEVIKISPEYGLKLQKAFTDQQTGQNENLKSELEIVAKKNDVLSAAAVPVYMQIQKMRADGRTDAEIDAAVMPAVMQVITTLKNQTLPNGKPILSPEEMQGVVSGLQRGGLANAMDTWMMNSEKTKGLIESRLKAESKFGPTKTMTGDQGPGVYERNESTGKWKKVGGQVPTAAERGGGGAGAAPLSANAADLIIDRIQAGESVGDATKGLGPLAKRQIVNRMGELAGQTDENGEPLIDAKTLFNARIEAGAVRKATETAGTQAGRLKIAEKELEQFAGPALAASAKVPRGSFVPLNKLNQTIDSAISDPALREFKMWANSLSNTYDQIAGRGGTDVEKRAEVRDLLSTAPDAESFKRVIEVMRQELKGAEAATAAAMKAETYQEQPSHQTGGAPKQITEGTIIYSNDPTKPNKILRGGEWQVMQ